MGTRQIVMRCQKRATIPDKTHTITTWLWRPCWEETSEYFNHPYTLLLKGKHYSDQVQNWFRSLSPQPNAAGHIMKLSATEEDQGCQTAWIIQMLKTSLARLLLTRESQWRSLCRTAMMSKVLFVWWVQH